MRRSFVPRPALMLFLAIAGPGREVLAQTPDVAPAPNIVFILADDLSYLDISFFGQTQFKTPNIDRLAREGRVFHRAFAGGPWCAPSRTALLTGRSSRRFFSATLGEPYPPTVADVLSEAGYATGFIGKWHMMEPGDSSLLQSPPPASMPWHRGFQTSRVTWRRGWNYLFPHAIATGDDREIAIPENASVDEDYFRKFYGVSDSFTLWHRGEGIYNEQGLFVDQTGHDITSLRHVEDLSRDEAVNFIEVHRNEPFFLLYSSVLVHCPVVGRDLSRFAGKPPEWTTMHKAYADMVEEFDRSVGVLLSQIEKQGLAERTIVFFSSDNGYTAGFNFPEPGVAWGPQLNMWKEVPLFRNKGPWNRGKHINTGGGLRVPFVAWGPGRIPAGESDRAVGFVDLLETARELGRAGAPQNGDGRSIVALLEGRDHDLPTRAPLTWSGEVCLHASMHDDWAEDAKPTAEPAPDGPFRPDAALLDERYLSMVFDTGRAKAVRVFDLVSDPAQKTDLSEKRPDLVARTRDLLTPPPAPSHENQPSTN